MQSTLIKIKSAAVIERETLVMVKYTIKLKSTRLVHLVPPHPPSTHTHTHTHTRTRWFNINIA